MNIITVHYYGYGTVMKSFVYFFLFCVLSFNTVFAQSSDTIFDQYDSNSDNEWTIEDFTGYYDGVISSKCENTIKRMSEFFDREDINGDGFVSLEESEFIVNKFRMNPRKANLVVDNKVSKNDFIKCPSFTVQQMFDDFDKDKNGIISKHEWDLKKRAGYSNTL